MVGKSNWKKADEQNRHRRKQKNYEARVEAFVKTLVTGKVHIVMRVHPEGLRVMATNYEKWLAFQDPLSHALNSHNVQYIATPEKAEAWLRRQIARTRRKAGIESKK